MLKDYFTYNLVKLQVAADTPDEAIKAAGDLLVRESKVNDNYVEEMIKTYKKLGSYIVLAPGIALPHSRPSEDVKETCVSFVQLRKPVYFNHPANDPVRLVFALGGVSHDGHIGMLQELGRLLSDPEKVDKLMNIKSYDEFLETIS